MCRQGHDKERLKRTEEGLSRSEGQGRSEKRTRREGVATLKGIA